MGFGQFSEIIVQEYIREGKYWVKLGRFVVRLYKDHLRIVNQVLQLNLQNCKRRPMLTLLLAFILILTLTGVHPQSNLYTRVLHSQQRGGACLDGTPPALYYHLGSGENRNKYLIFFEGGGFCGGYSLAETLQSCYRRSDGNLGSSKNLPPTADLNRAGIIATNPQLNPIFHDWTKIFILYCDGSEYSGSKADPISYKDKLLYFRGYNNVMESFRFLDEQFDFYNGESIVITGVSAGGIATFLYSNYLTESTKKAKVYAIPDSGLFITEYYSPFAKMENIKARIESLFKITLSEGIGFPIPECMKEFDEYYHCYNAANLGKHLKAPFLIIESPYDSYSIQNIVYTNCMTNKDQPYSLQDCNETVRQVIEDYREETFAALRKIRGNRKDVGAWMPSCVQHGFTDNQGFNDPHYMIPSGNGITIPMAITEFLINPQNARIHVDALPWPSNQGCSGKN